VHKVVVSASKQNKHNHYLIATIHVGHSHNSHNHYLMEATIHVGHSHNHYLMEAIIHVGHSYNSHNRYLMAGLFCEINFPVRQIPDDLFF